ncbi:MAG: DUF6029 family protein, partial [Chitinophagales bacterium]
MRKLLSVLFFTMVMSRAFSQGSFSGDLQLNTEFYQSDSAIGATGTPHYDNLLSGAYGWLSTYYRNEPIGLEVGVRLDMFNNANLHNPGIPYTDAGIGRWYISKKLDALT